MKSAIIISTLGSLLLPSSVVSPKQLKSVEYAAFNSIYDLCGTGLASRGGSTTTAKYGCGWGLICSNIKNGPSQICLPNATLSNSIGKSCIRATDCDPGTRCSIGKCVGVRTRYNTCGRSAYQTSGYPKAECANGYICGRIPAIGIDGDAFSSGRHIDSKTAVINVCLDRIDDFENIEPPARDLVKRSVGKGPQVCYNGACTALSRNPVI